MSKLIEYFWIFIVGSFIGFLSETIWCVIRWRKLESRKGLIYGYLIPIYGIATVLISFVVELFNIRHYGMFFLLTFLIVAIVEYVSSLVQEKCFGTKSWDYSKMIGNLNGRVNILYLSLWSLLGLLWCRYYGVLIEFIINILDSAKLLNFVTLIGFIFLIYDCYISIVASYRQKLRRRGISPRNKYERWLDKKYSDEVLKKIYANALVVE